MTDLTILYAGMFCFAMTTIGVVFTIVEFGRIARRSVVQTSTVELRSLAGTPVQARAGRRV